MDAFYLTISIISIVFLILILTFFGMIMRTHNQGLPFPPTKSDCPDYWKVGEDGLCTATVKPDGTYFNSGLLSMPLSSPDYAPYTTSSNTFDPQDIKWSATGKSTVCAQRDWSLQNGIVWDGVSSYNGC